MLWKMRQSSRAPLYARGVGRGEPQAGPGAESVARTSNKCDRNPRCSNLSPRCRLVPEPAHEGREQAEHSGS